MNQKLRQIGSIFLGMAVSCGLAQAQKSSLIKRQLNDGWQFRSLRTPEPSQQQDWRAATVPGVVQSDLLHYGLIPDPFYGLNEPKYQWVGLSDWEYRTTFSLTREEQTRKHVDLVFNGLDTYAEVYLNGEQILKADNMFRQWRLPTTGKLRTGANELRIVFHSPVTTVLAEIKTLPFRLPSNTQVTEVSDEGIPTDSYTRKAPYQYGWDFNPRLLTEGIWQPILLESWNDLRVDDLHIQQRSIAKEAAYFDTELTIEADHAGTAVVEVSERDAAAHAEAAYSQPKSTSVQLHEGTNRISIPSSLASPRLWWPNGYGPQSMYRIRAVVRMQGDEEQASRDIGFRTVELRREKDADGKSFVFIVNGVPIFAKGASIVPIDVFPGQITRDRVEKMLIAARDVNMNMLRVWGGGIYEPDFFYEISDKLGLMVWHDFMFGNEQPAYSPAFLETTRHEAIDQVTRLRNHPSIVLWCGNNEVEKAWSSWKDRKEFASSLTLEQRDAVWGGYIHLTNGVLGGVVATYAPDTPYWPSSPSADYDEAPSNSRDGDMHSWTVWFNNKPASLYTTDHPRFMSEYGFESFPAMATLQSFAAPDQLSLDSATMTEHQKSMGAKGNRFIADAVQRDYGKPVDFAALVYLSQVEQADAVRTGAEDFRRLRPHCMGSLYWELQDAWPDIYSSSIDYFGRWKALQWYAKRFYAPLLVSPRLRDGKIDVFAISDLQQATKGTIRIRLMDFSGKTLLEKIESVDISPLSSTSVLTLDEKQFLNGQDPKKVFAYVEWMQGDQLLSSNSLFFLPVKDLLLPKATIHWSVAADGSTLRLSSDVFAHDVSIEFQDPDARPSDNFFDLLPGQPIEIGVQSKEPLRTLIPHVMSMMDALSQ